ncbi:serine/threonine protein phosphatase, partial [Streptomyces sp. SID5910]|nr:serine/threonine protein phosphatase [Streptomyces sp. SID5910]
MTEHPTSFERPPTGADPTDSGGAFLRAPVPPRSPDAALPAQGRPGETPPVQGGAVFEHSQPGAEHAAGSDTHRPRPAAEGGVPVQPDGTSAGAPSGQGGREAAPEPDRRTGQPTAPGRPTPMRRDGDRLRFVGAATRRI